MFIRILCSLTLALVISVGSTTLFAQGHSKDQVQQFEGEFLKILEAGITPFQEKGEFIELGSGGGFSNSRTNITANRRFEFQAPDGSSRVTYDILLGKYDSDELGRGGAEAVTRQLAVEVKPSRVIGVNEKLPGEGELEIGDSSYYVGVHSAANTRTSYQSYRHTAFSQRGQWLVKIEVTISKEDWNEAVKTQQKAILQSLINSTDGTEDNGGLATTPPPVFNIPNLAGNYQIEGNDWRLEQDGQRVFGTNEVDGVTVTFETKHTVFTQMNAKGEVEEREAFMGTYEAVNTNLDQMNGEIRFEETAVDGEIKLTTYFTADGERQSQTVVLKKR